MTVRVPTPFGGVAVGSRAAQGQGVLKFDSTGEPIMVSDGITTVATAPTYTPGANDDNMVFCTADSKLYVWTTGTTWVKTAALS